MNVLAITLADVPWLIHLPHQHSFAKQISHRTSPPSEWADMSDPIPQPTSTDTAVFNAVSEVYDGATRAQTRIDDENGWSPVVRRMLSAVVELPASDEWQRSIFTFFDA